MVARLVRGRAEIDYGRMKTSPLKTGLISLPLLLIMACGGSGSDTSNPLNTTDLSETELDALAAQLQSTTSSAMASSSSPSLTLAPQLEQAFGQVSSPVSFSYPISGVEACPIAGHITYSGNVSGSASETAWSLYGLITFLVSDPTNNLNDCEVAAGVILDGTLTFTVSGNSTEGVGASLTGTITVNSRGPTGGLVPRGSCYIFLNVPRGGSQATGTVCGHSVS